MKELSRLLLLIIGMTAATAMAQKADSVIVIYKNQQTIIPVPVYKSQSSVSYSDSIKVIEIGVSHRKPGDISLFPQNPYDNLTIEKHKSTSKWFSQIEAGYIIGFTENEDEFITMHTDVSPPSSYVTHTHMSDSKGYQLRLLLHEKEYFLDKKKSFVSGFELGFSQTFLDARRTIRYDTSFGALPNASEVLYKFRINNFQVMYRFGISYYITKWEVPARINIGNCLGFSVTKIIDKNDKIHQSYSHINTTLLQPYLGFEISKIGVLLSADLNVPQSSHNILIENDKGRNICLSLTYRIF